MIGVYGGKAAHNLVNQLSVALLIIAVILLVFFFNEGDAFNGAYLADPFARFMKILALAGSGIALIMAIGHQNNDETKFFEFPILILLATVGMMLMISANDLIALYLGLELQSLALYVIAAINRNNQKSTEAWS